MNEFSEKEVLPPGPGFNNDIQFRTHTPKKLETLETIEMKAAYDPILPGLLREWQEPQTIVFWAPMFLMSGVGMLEKKVAHIKGYLKFVSINMGTNFSEGEMPEATVSIVPTTLPKSEWIG